MSTQRTRGEGSRGPAYNARTANGPATSNAQPDGQQQQKPKAPRPPRPDPYEHLPPFPEPGTRPRVIYTRRVEDVNTLAPFLAAGGIVGYDQEWKPNYQANQVENKVATIQVAGVHLVLVAHISDMSGECVKRCGVWLEAEEQAQSFRRLCETFWSRETC